MDLHILMTRINKIRIEKGASTPNKAQGRLIVLVVPIAVPVVEALVPRIVRVVAVLRGGTVPTGGIRTGNASMAIFWS